MALAAYLPGLAIAGPAVKEPAGYWMGASHGPVTTTLSGGTVIHTRKLAALLQAGGVLVIDVSDAPRRSFPVRCGSRARGRARSRHPSTSYIASIWRSARTTILRTGS